MNLLMVVEFVIANLSACGQRHDFYVECGISFLFLVLLLLMRSDIFIIAIGNLNWILPSKASFKHQWLSSSDHFQVSTRVQRSALDSLL